MIEDGPRKLGSWTISLTAPVAGLVLLAGALVLCLGGRAAADVDVAQFEKDLQVIAASPSRVIGSEGCRLATDYVQRQIEALPNVQLQVHRYPVMAPVTRKAELTLADGSVQKVYPFWPASIRVNSTPAEGIKGRLVYVGQADFKQINPVQLQDQIAVMETSSGPAWTQAAYFGARAIIILGGPGTINGDLREQELTIPVSIPRFYIPDGPLAKRLRQGEVSGTATLMADVGWELREARNLYALVRPGPLAAVNGLPPLAQSAVARATNLGPAGWTGLSNPAALLISAPLDSSGLVPDLANGAGQAVQAAAALALLRDLSRQPLDRPVIVFFSGADGIQYLGTRQMFMALADAPVIWRNQLAELAEKQQILANDLKRAAEIAADPTKLHIARDRSLIDRIVKLIETDAADQQDELFRIRMKRQGEKNAQTAAREKELDIAQRDLSALKFAIEQTPADLPRTLLPSNDPAAGDLARAPSRSGPASEAESLLPPARAYIQKTIERMQRLTANYADRQRELERRVELYRWLAGQLHRDSDPDERATNNRLLDVQIALDLSDRGVRVGPMYYGQWARSSAISQIQDLRSWFDRIDPEKTDWFQAVKPVFDLEPLKGARALPSWLCASMPIGSELAQAWGVPGFALMTLDDLRPLRDTPLDTLENLNLKAIVPQLQAVRTVLWRAWNDPTFKGPVELKQARKVIVEGQVVSPAAGRPVPDLPRERFLATYYYASTGKSPVIKRNPWTMGVRRNEVALCDAEGNYRFEGVSRLEGGGNAYRMLAIQVYRLSPDGSVNACSDLGKQSGDIKLLVDLAQELDPIRSLVFNCQEFMLVGLYDPRFLQDLGEVTLLDQRRNAEPQRYNYLLFKQMMAGFVEPGQSSYLLFRYGRAGNRLLLVNMKEKDSSERPTGYLISDPAGGGGLRELGPLAIRTAADFWRIDEQRLEEYRKVGVKSDLVDALHQQAKDQIFDASGKPRTYSDGQELMREATGGWANESRVYYATRDMANDVIRGAIFLLLLCIPFAFCMERLLIGTPNIYRQIGGVAAIFAVMAIALSTFHPAFQISKSPLIIILAFGIIFMSVVVIWVVYGKFDTELKRLRSGRGSTVAASFARASVLMSAVLLGIANMRKRKFRTALTSITIILITFAVLCFTSASRYLDTTTLPTGVARQYSGLMLRQRGFRPMPSISLENLRSVLQRPGAVRGDIPGHRVLVERWWNLDAGDIKNQTHLVAGGNPASGKAARVFPVQAVLGLSPGESNLALPGERAPIAQIIPNFQRLEAGEERIIYLATPVAEQLAVKAGDTVKVGGMDLEVAGVFDPVEFDGRVNTLSGEPIAPLNYVSGALDAGGRRLTDAGADDLQLDPDSVAAEVGQSYEHLSASQIAIVPAAVSRLLPNASLRSVALRLADQGEVEKVSNELAKRFAVAMYAGYDDGVRMVAASNLASVSGAGQVAIPLAIAGLIIFNTMMGSIAERRREIHVYTSLGLAPLHVGALFVAEAMTYGLIGTVFGYVIGQGVGTALLKLGWLGNVTLNYSGTSAMLTMGLILVIVLLSALVPARLASKIAAPSIERTWKVPMPKGDEILAHLPFTINKTAADGVLAYLAEFFDAHQEGSIGKFSSGKIEFFLFEDEKGRASRGLKTIIWLTPFDLGVRQHLMLLIHPGQYEDIYEVQVILQRLSGDDGSWYRMNRTFLTELRKQFLQWRSLTPQRMLEFVEQSRKLFDEKIERIVHTAPAEDARLG